MYQTIYFDMDGTLANLYGVRDWLPKLRAEDPSPYMDACPMLRLSQLARQLNALQRQGYHIGIISWLSKESTRAYDVEVTIAKTEWLKAHMPSVTWDEIHIVPHGVPKSEAAHIQPFDILFDDEQKNLDEWEQAGGWGFFPDEIFEILRGL